MSNQPQGRRDTSPRRSLLIGLAFAAAYLVAGGLSFRGGLLPRAPVLDGLGPPAPYQWVKPPPDRTKDNKPPHGATGTVPLTSIGSAGSVNTPDGQATLLFDSNSVPVSPGQTAVKVTIQPADPDTVGPPPAGGYHYNANAYKFDAVYQPSGQALTTLTATVELSYATSASTIFHWNGGGWDPLSTTPAGQNQLFVPATQLGTFVAAGTATGGTAPKQANPVVLVSAIVGIFGVIAVVIVVILLSQRRSRRPQGR